jgi:hypothetical protein
MAQNDDGLCHHPQRWPAFSAATTRNADQHSEARQDNETPNQQHPHAHVVTSLEQPGCYRKAPTTTRR